MFKRKKFLKISYFLYPSKYSFLFFYRGTDFIWQIIEAFWFCWTRVESACFARGDHTFRVPMSLFRGNRERLLQRLRKSPDVALRERAFVVLQGGVEIPFNDTDVAWPFRQVRQQCMLHFYTLRNFSLRLATWRISCNCFIFTFRVCVSSDEKV